MDSVVTINHVLSVVGKYIFDSSYKKALPLNIDSLNLFCSCYDEDGLCSNYNLSIMQWGMPIQKQYQSMCRNDSILLRIIMYEYDIIMTHITRESWISKNT